MSRTYYNEWDRHAAGWLRNLIAAGLLPAGDVDERSICDVQPGDLGGYVQCHFFAGIGGWPYAAQLAGWPEDRPLWTGSCPCQPFSKAGLGQGFSDERHLWPEFFRLIRACVPDTIMGEQVASAIKVGWLDAAFDDLEGQGYTCGAAIVPADAVGGAHRRDRIWFVADAGGPRPPRPKHDSLHPSRVEQPQIGQRCGEGIQVGLLTEPDSISVCRIDGLPRPVDIVRAYGNAIVPQLAAEVIGAFLDAEAA